MDAPRRCLSLVKGVHRYVFCYGDGQEASLLSAFVALAADPGSDFDWLDAAILSYQLGKQVDSECGASV